MRNKLFSKLKTETLTFNGKNLEVNVLVEAFYDWDYDASMDDDETIEKIENGSLTLAVIIVTASFEGVEGSDSLGGCLIGKERDVLEYAQDHDMVANALKELENNLTSLMEKLA